MVGYLIQIPRRDATQTPESYLGCQLISGTGLVVRSSGEPSQLRYTNAERGKHDMGVGAPCRPSKGL